MVAGNHQHLDACRPEPVELAYHEAVAGCLTVFRQVACDEHNVGALSHKPLHLFVEELRAVVQHNALGSEKILPGLTVVDDEFGRHDVDVRQYGYLRVGPCCEQAAPKCYHHAEESSHLFSGFLSFPFAKIRRISDKSKKSSAFIWFSACLFVPLPPKYGNLVADAA